MLLACFRSTQTTGLLSLILLLLIAAPFSVIGAEVSPSPSASTQHAASSIQTGPTSSNGQEHAPVGIDPSTPPTMVIKKDENDERAEWERMWIETIASMVVTCLVFFVGYRLAKMNDQEKEQREVVMQILRDARTIKQVWIAILRTERELAEIEGARNNYGTEDDSKRISNEAETRLQERHATLRDRRADLMTSLSTSGTMARLVFGPLRSARLELGLDALQSAAMVPYSKIRERIEREESTKDFSGALIVELARIDLIIRDIQDRISDLMRPIMSSSTPGIPH